MEQVVLDYIMDENLQNIVLINNSRTNQVTFPLKRRISETSKAVEFQQKSAESYISAQL